MKDINEVMLHPVRMRIIQEISARQSITSKELCERIRDVPRTTMYRYINILLDNSILSDVSLILEEYRIIFIRKESQSTYISKMKNYKDQLVKVNY